MLQQPNESASVSHAKLQLKSSKEYFYKGIDSNGFYWKEIWAEDVSAGYKNNIGMRLK